MASLFKELQGFEGYQLFLVKKSWKEEYDLTDFQNLYAHIYKNGILSNSTNYTSSSRSLNTDNSLFYDMRIKTIDGKIIASTDTSGWGTKTKIKLSTGAEYTFFSPTQSEYFVITDSNNYQLMDFERGSNCYININLYIAPKSVEEFEPLLFIGLTSTIDIMQQSRSSN